MHEFVVGAVAQRLMLLVHRGGVLGGLGGPFLGKTAGQDLLSGPGVDGVGGGLDLEHAVGDVFGRPLLGVSGASGGALELAELAAAFIHGDHAGVGIEVSFDQLVLVLACDLADPAGGAVAHDEDLELGGVLAGGSQHR